MNQNPQSFDNNPQNSPNNPQYQQPQYQQPDNAPQPPYQQPYQQQYQQPYQQQYQQPYQQPYNVPPQGKGMAIASMVLGIVGAVFCWFSWFCFIALALGVVSVVLAVKSRNKIPVGVPGRGMATAGLVLGIIACALSGIAAACWISIFACAGCTTCAGANAVNGALTDLGQSSLIR